jgi:hypothetical protein
VAFVIRPSGSNTPGTSSPRSIDLACRCKTMRVASASAQMRRRAAPGCGFDQVKGDFGRLLAVSDVRTVGLSVWSWIRWQPFSHRTTARVVLASPSSAEGGGGRLTPLIGCRRLWRTTGRGMDESGAPGKVASEGRIQTGRGGVLNSAVWW